MDADGLRLRTYPRRLPVLNAAYLPRASFNDGHWAPSGRTSRRRFSDPGLIAQGFSSRAMGNPVMEPGAALLLSPELAADCAPRAPAGEQGETIAPRLRDPDWCRWRWKRPTPSSTSMCRHDVAPRDGRWWAQDGHDIRRCRGAGLDQAARIFQDIVARRVVMCVPWRMATNGRPFPRVLQQAPLLLNE